MNEVTNTRPTGLAGLASLAAGLANVRQSLPATLSGIPLMRLLKDGQWVVGAQDTPLPAGTAVVINPSSIQTGWSCWTNRQPGQGKNERLGEELWPFGTPKAPVQTLPVHHDPRTQERCVWKDIMAVDAVVLDGELADQQVLYNTTSVGGLRALNDLVAEVMKRVNAGSTYYMPIVLLSSDSYQHSSYGRTYFPVFQIDGWMDEEGNEDEDFVAGEEPVPTAPLRAAPPPAPPARTTRAKPAAEPVADVGPEPAAAAPVDDAAPTGRRRRV